MPETRDGAPDCLCKRVTDLGGWLTSVKGTSAIKVQPAGLRQLDRPQLTAQTAILRVQSREGVLKRRAQQLKNQSGALAPPQPKVFPRGRGAGMLIQSSS